MTFCDFELCKEEATQEYLDKKTWKTRNVCVAHWLRLVNLETAEMLEKSGKPFDSPNNDNSN